ncbi:glycine--tRNA ligase [Rhizocola hellebori]|uniref:Multifunctional fusion protein n=1 Tax=Rhizocola hellebori TaxID=1392758 RepID=A0A8J3QKR7_9ACTN|nr:glycine--tRNA ligase [Rhizocola hellebori]GIH11213.1 glycine--tRNA ligase [Rhizocola hellebori]
MTDLTMQDALSRLSTYWSGRGCLTVQPMNTEVGAGTLNPATALRVLGPEPWRVAYAEPSVRPDDARYGENPNRVQCHTQFQVILKPEPGNAQELYLDSLAALGIDIEAHDIRFVEDNWASPALGAWGLGWEVWLDGLEITQFTYFQQAGGITLDPVSVEITYGMERILMALQNVRHFKDITYAPGVTYGEVFGQAEYEMSRYYLDDADVATNRALLDSYAAEAQRMIDVGLPIPAHSFVLKMSHAFNVLDARGAVSTADRANEFARMRKLSNSVAKLWIASREKAGYPLGIVEPQTLASPYTATTGTTTDSAAPLVFEIGVEELPPHEAQAARERVESALIEQLAAGRLAYGQIQVHATPRRITAIVEDVAARELDHVRIVRGPRVAIAFDSNGAPTAAASGFARSNGVTVDDLQWVTEGGIEHVAIQRTEIGRPAAEALAPMLASIVTDLRSAKNMRWNDPALSFSRPIRWLLVLWGDQIVPVVVSSLTAGRTTRIDRTAAQPVLTIASAADYLPTIADNAIHLDERERRRIIVDNAVKAASTVGGSIDVDGEGSLIDQICFLVEEPTAIVGGFDASYLSLPDAVLTTVMRKHQRYLPIRDASGALLPHFVVMANGRMNTEVVRAGNEAVLRARFEDAAFFHRADLEMSIDSMREHLTRLTFTDQLGSMHDRAFRVAAIAKTLSAQVSGVDVAVLDRAASLVKFDLGSQMVTEMTSLAGVMAREYLVAAGAPQAVAEAVFEAELPRHAGDQLPVSLPGALLALADKLDSLAGLAATVGLPTGSSDPFALRRAALGVIALHRNTTALTQLSLLDALGTAAAQQPVPVAADTVEAVLEFLARRLEQQLLDEGHPVDRVRAVLLHAHRPRYADRILAQLNGLSDRSDFRRLAAALQRARRIVPAGQHPPVSPADLTEPAEQRLHETVVRMRGSLGEAVDLDRLVSASHELPDAVDDFFDALLVMAEDPAVRATRIGLVASVAELGDGVLDWSELRL